MSEQSNPSAENQDVAVKETVETPQASVDPTKATVEQTKAKADRPKAKPSRGNQQQKRKAPYKKGNQKRPWLEYIPGASSSVLKDEPSNHPGLLISKHALLLSARGKRLEYHFSGRYKQIYQKVCHALSSKTLKAQWELAVEQRKSAFQAVDMHTEVLTSVGPTVFQTAHLNQPQGMDYHAIYGFPIISGNNIKGAVKSYVSTHWLPQQSDQSAAQAQIDSVFGKPGQPADISFQDAWPDAWPELEVRVHSNHASAYYENRKAPADWQSTEADFFIALARGAQFRFAIGKRQSNVSDTLVELSKNWLMACLTQSGIGTFKHNGYGLWSHPEHAALSSDASYKLKLESPAFLGGALEDVSACQLTPDTLRGALRYWWRTLQAGYLDIKMMHRLETALWGSATKKGAIRLFLEPVSTHKGYRFKWPALASQLPQFKTEREKGIDYLLHGLKEEANRSYFLSQGLEWNLAIHLDEVVYKSKNSKSESVSLSKEVILKSLEGALALLVEKGGIGARHRKGFGSLSIKGLPEDTLTQAAENAQSLRTLCSLKSEFKPQWQETAVHEQAFGFEIQTPWKNPWFALHQVGSAMQKYAIEHKHRGHKVMLGLPRRIGTPIFNPLMLDSRVESRHGSPVRTRLKSSDAGYIVSVTAYPAPQLPNLEESKTYLTAYLDALKVNLDTAVTEQKETEVTYPLFKPRPRRKSTGDRKPQKPRSDDRKRSDRNDPRNDRNKGKDSGRKPFREFKGKSSPMSKGPKKPAKAQAGHRLEALLLEEKTKKGGWKAQDPKSKLSGPVVNSGLVNGEAGDKVELMIHAINKFEMLFRWPTEADNAPPKPRPKKKEKGFFDM